jgi:tetratricopeptide (TPR) repeat protein
LLIETNGKEDIMNCEKFRKLLDKANEMAENNIWGEKAYVINLKIWAVDNNNFTACTRLAKYYKLINNIPEAKRMYLKALEIYPNNLGVRNNLNEIKKLYEETKFIDELATSRECYFSGQKLTQKGHHWLASECYFKAYSIEPLLKYGVSLGKSYRKLGEHDKIKKLYKNLMDSNPSFDIIEDIKVEFEELLKGKIFEQKKENLVYDCC